MTQISKAAFNTTWAHSAGTFADNTTRAISEADMRQFAQDIKDSVPFNLDASIAQFVSTKITIPSASVLTANATPVTLVAAQGAGTVLELQNIMLYLDYNSAAYATNTDVEILVGSVQIISFSSILSNTADYYQFYGAVNFATGGSITNQPLTFKVPTGNPTAGNSPVYAYVTYRVITL